MKDFFISHASDDKAEVARPLARALEEAGAAIWLDEYELTVGDSLRQKIDDGLLNARYGVIIVSPAFLAPGRYWTEAEFDGLVQKEVSGQKVILPVWYHVDRADVAARSPVLAGRLAARWSEGLSKVVQDLLRAINSDSLPTAEKQSASPEARMLSNVLVREEARPDAYFHALRSRGSETSLTLVVRPRNADERARLLELQRSRPSCMIALDDEAYHARVVDVERERTVNGDEWAIDIEKAALPYQGIEASYDNVSADRLAELRAQLILLGTVESAPEMQRDGHQREYMRMFITGATSDGVNAEPLPVESLRTEAPNHDEFIVRARLWAVMMLVLSDTVEHVLSLDLDLSNEGIGIRFHGRRARKYSNEVPAEIRVHGRRPI